MRKRTGTLLGSTTPIGTTVAPPAAPVSGLVLAPRAPVTMKEARKVGADALEALGKRERDKAARNAEDRRIRNERDERDARETAWVRDQLERDIREAGDPVELVEVRAVYDGWTATVFQWLPHGICRNVEHTLRHTRPNYQDDHKEPKLRKVVNRRFAKLLRIQSDMCARMGRPRTITAEDIDLSRFTIEAPVAAILDEALGEEAGPRLRKAMAENRTEIDWRWNRECDDVRLRTGVEKVELRFGRDTVGGAFQTSGKGFSFRWSKGGLQLFRAGLPDSVVPAMAGRRVGEVVEHPLLDADMLITSASLMGRGGEEGVALTVKDAARPMPAGW